MLAILLGGSIPGLAYLAYNDSPADSGSPGASLDNGSTTEPDVGFSQIDREVATSLRLLSSLTGANLSQSDTAGTVQALEASRGQAPDSMLKDPGTVLRAVEGALSNTTVYRSPVESDSLSEAIDRYALARDLDPLTPRERERVEATPEPVRKALVPLVDALSFATRQRAEAFSDLDQSEQATLLSLAAGLSPGSNETLEPEQAERFRNITSRIETGRLLHAGRVLATTVLDTRERLSSLGENELQPVEAPSDRTPEEAASEADEPEPPIRRTNDDLLSGAADVLDERGGAEVPPPAVSSGSLDHALDRLVREQFPGVSTGSGVQGAERFDRFPSSLRDALTNVVDAYAGTSGEAASSSGQAANLLRALADDVATLERWSLILSVTPPNTHFRSASEAHDRNAGLALAASGRAQSVTDSLRLAASHSGLPGGQPTPTVDAPPLRRALDAWETAFDVERTPEEETKLSATADALPDHAADALATLLWAQARAADMVDDLSLSASRHDDLLRAAQSVNEILGSASVPAESLDELEAFQGFTSRQAETGVRAGLLISAATARANEILEAAPDGEEDPEEAARDSGQQVAPTHAPRRPGSGDASPPEKPSSGAEPTGPYADAERDIWFQDPSGMILVTGEGSTTYPNKFFAATLDLGGNDVRPDNAGGVTRDASQPFAVSIDAGGDDRYVSEIPFAQGAVATDAPGVGFRVGILADYGGDDLYKVRGFGQGAAYMGGLGLLYDASGNDRYVVEGSLPRGGPSFEVAGGQGYAFSGIGNPQGFYPPALGVHVDTFGNDTYAAANGQGAGIALQENDLANVGVRSSSGVLIETGGADRYSCQSVCLGDGRLGSPATLECEGDGTPCMNVFGVGSARERPGIGVATGTLLETDGHDEYTDKGGPNNRVGPASAGAHPNTGAGEILSGRVGLRVNQSTRVDVSLSDTNRDFVPDVVAQSLGYDPEETGEGPAEDPYRSIDPRGLAVGRDDDGDGFSNELERRLGTSPNDADSAPVVPPTAATGNDAGKLLDVRLDLTTGTLATREQMLPERSPVAWVGIWPELSQRGSDGAIDQDGSRTRVHSLDTFWGQGGTDTDDTRVSILGVGDSVHTLWEDDYAISIDLGGSDGYRNNAGAGTEAAIREEGESSSGSSLPGLALDIGGSDRYEREGSVASQGTGAYGANGVLVDLFGDDRYRAEQAAQGSAIGPGVTGVLVDAEGDDTYTANEGAQGFSGPECETATSLVADEFCQDESTNCDRDADGCRARESKTTATSLLLDARGSDRYTSNGQGVLEPNDLEPEGAVCYGCPTEVPIPNGGPVPPYPTPEAGPYTDAPSSTGYPAPFDQRTDPTGDTATFLDLDGDDTYEVRGHREPVKSQGYARGEGVPAQGSATFLDVHGVDRYRQLPPPDTRKSVQVHDKNNHVYLNGVPTTEEAHRLVSVFLDAERRPDRISDDGDVFPDLVESWLGTEPVDERHLDGEPPSDLESRSPVETDGFPGVDGSRTIRSDPVLTVPRLGLLVSGYGDTLHDEPKTLLVDLGGDDRYTAPVGAGVGDPYDARDTPADVGVLLDVSGDDTYETRLQDLETRRDRAYTGATQGAGVLGIGIHVDPQGDDLYNVTLQTPLGSQAPSLGLSQGAAFQGVGVLLGSDQGTYRVNLTTNASASARLILGLSQGAAWGGVGLQFTHPSPFSGWLTQYNVTAEPSRLPRGGAQGFAIEGVGLLVDAGLGPNRFAATGAAQGASYPHQLSADEGVTAGTAYPTNPLGTSRGGGLGLLASGTGSDSYEAGSFAQGAASGGTPSAGLGKAWVGALVDLGGHDDYELQPGNASTPAAGQGLGIMGGTGLLLDQAGNDAYHAGASFRNVSAAQGSALTRGGNVPGVEFGPFNIEEISAPPAVTRGVLADLDGNDRYAAEGHHVHGAARALLFDEGPGEVTASPANALLYEAAGEDVYEAPHAPAVGEGPTLTEASGEAAGDAAPDGVGGLAEETCRGTLLIPRGVPTGPTTCEDVLGPYFGLIPEAPDVDLSNATVEVALSGTGAFLDAEGADRYDPLPHPNATSVDAFTANPTGSSTGPAAGERTGPSSNGPGNDEVWTLAASTDRPGQSPLSRLALGVDAPSRGAALRAVTDLPLHELGLGLATVTTDVLQASTEGDCGEAVAPEDEPASGTLCIRATVRQPDEAAARVKEVRFYAVTNQTHPATVSVLPGRAGESVVSGDEPGDRTVTEYTTPWDTAPPQFPDGNVTVRAEAVFAPREIPGRAETPSAATVEDETGIELDNPPWVTVEADRWVNPERETLDLTVVASGEDGTANPTLEIRPCDQDKTIGELSRKSVTPGEETTWTVRDVPLGYCPTKADALSGRTGNVTIAGWVSDDDGKQGPIQPTRIGVDRRPPSIEVDAPPAVNRSVAQSGSFRVAWNATEEVADFGFGRVQRVDVNVSLNGAPKQNWKVNAPPRDQALWEGFQDGGTVTFYVTARDVAGNSQTNRRTLDVDLERPQLQDPRVEPRYIQSGDPVTFAVNASDEGGIGRAIVEVGGERYAMDQNDGSWTFDGFSEVSERLAEERGANASRPEGYAFRFILEDQVGNRASTIEQQAFIDDVPPTIHDARIVYPDGTAAGPGDLLRLQVNVSDEIGLPGTITANVGNVSSSGETLLRRNAATGNFTGVFVLDREPEPENATVQVVAGDRAGNVARETLPVHIATEPPTVSKLQVVNRTATTTTLSWRTDVPSTARVLVSSDATEEAHEVQVSGTSTEHEVTVEQLRSSTRYEVQLVPVNAAGVSGDARSLTTTTATAIDLDVAEPEVDSVHSGTLTVGWNATDPTGASMTFAFSLSSTDREIPISRQLRTVDAAPGRPHETSLDTTRVSDGDYKLVVEAERGHDRAVETVTNLTIDNTAPLVRLEEPRPGAHLAPGSHALRIVALDRLAGVDADSVRVHAGGESVDATQLGEGAYTAEIDLPATEAQRVEVTARDAAGNVARQTAPFFVETGLESGASLGLELPGDQTAVKPGDEVTVHLRSGGDTDVTDARVLPSDLAGTEPIPFEPAPEGAILSFEVPEDVSEGLTPLYVDPTGSGGASSRLSADVSVDRTDPEIEGANATLVGKSLVFLRVCANEHVRVEASARAPDAASSNATTRNVQPCHELELDGLTPGTRYGIHFTAFDGADNEMTRTINVTTEPDQQAPVPPSELEARVPTDDVVRLTWGEGRDDTAVQGYQVRRTSADGSSWQAVGTTTSTEFVDRSVTPGRTYRYAVRTLDVAGNPSESSAQAELTTRGSPSLSEGAVSPEKGSEARTYTFQINYTGPLEEATRVLVEIDGSQHRMEPVDDPESCWNGCTFQYRTSLSADQLGGEGHRYRFTASANGFTTAFPDDGRAEHGPVVTASDGTFPGGTATILGGTVAGIAGVLGGAVALLRRFGGGGL